MATVSNSRVLRVIPLLLIMALFCPFVRAKVIYVDDDAGGANEGTNWENAHLCLQDALATARFGDEIQVAKGIYTPDQNFVRGRSPRVVASGDRTATFQLKNGIIIKGGYAGFGESDPNARNINLYETILSGDLNGDDGPGFTNNAENSYHVVTGSGTNETAVLEGFIVTAGNANGTNPKDNKGGGMYCELCTPRVISCTFTRNSAHDGGGVHNGNNSSPTVVDCTFSSNSAFNKGGGIFNDDSHPKVNTCTISGNYSDSGGGMYNDNSSPTVTDCTFSGNSADKGGGAMNNWQSSPTLTNCTFSNNSAGWAGGAIGNVSWDEHTESSPIVTNCTFIDNSAGWDGGGMSNVSSHPTLINCVFSENSAKEGGGGMHSDAGNPTLLNCMFSGNSADKDGGGMVNYSGSRPMLTNCTFSGNSARGDGGGISNFYDCNPVLSNCIVWGNTAQDISQIHEDHTSLVIITYSDVQGGWPGQGNIHADPFFANPGYWIAGNPRTGGRDLWIAGDYHLKSEAGRWDPDSETWIQDDMTSPCIDAGDNSTISQSVVTDLDGNPRIVNGIVDMGAYEADVAPIANIYYIDADATGANDGSSWTDAYNYLQEALIDAEAAEKPVEIHVAQGIYKPSEGLGAAPEFDWRTTTFQLINGVTLQGGYAGFGEPDPDARDIDLYRTILSGDLNGDDGPDFTNNAENCYHVVTGSGTDETAILDGFTITNGNSNALKPYHAGGGIYNQNGSPTVNHCTFSANWAGRGGGMSNEGESNPTLMNCTFTGNGADFHGGGMYNLLSSPILMNCMFVGNSAPSGGGMYNWNNCSPTLTNCTFTGNTSNTGGGICSNRSSFNIVNTILWNDSPDEIYHTMSSISVTYCNVRTDQSLWPGEGNINVDPLFVDADGADGVIGTEDDDLHLSPGSPCINAGDNSAIPESVVTDLDGNSRILNGTVDMGAYEFSPESDPNLIGWWKFDEGSGYIAYDSSGYGNDGTFNGNPQWVPGHFNYALEFDGSGDWLDCGEDPSLQITDAVTFAAWIKLSATEIDQKVGGNQDDVNGGYKMTIYSNNRVEFEIRTSGNTPILNRDVGGGTVLQQDVWYHVAGVYSLKGNYIRTYVDGNLDRELVTTQVLGASEGPFRIGCEPFETGFHHHHFNGVMDDLRIYNIALSDAEIYALGLPRKPRPRARLMGQQM